MTPTPTRCPPAARIPTPTRCPPAAGTPPWRLPAPRAGCGPRTPQRGNVAIEFALGVGVLLLPVAMLVAVFPTWAERQSMARVAAAEAAREAAAAVDVASGQAAALALAAQIAANHSTPAHEVTAAVAIPTDPATGLPARGGEVEATVTVRLPLVAVPLIGHAGGFDWTVTRRVRIDDYRSFPPP